MKLRLAKSSKLFRLLIHRYDVKPKKAVVRKTRKCFAYSSFVAIVTGFLLALVIHIILINLKYQYPTPQAILVLGGEHQRECVAAKLAKQNTDLIIWVSSGLLPPDANEIFLNSNVALARVNLDYTATDTVTNFTTIVAELQAKDIQHIYLVTSDFHMPRAKAIAFWVLGSRGIAFTPVTVPSNQPPEPFHKTLRDITRSWLWLLTGRTGSSLDPNPPIKSSAINTKQEDIPNIEFGSQNSEVSLRLTSEREH